MSKPSARVQSGAHALCEALEAAGVECIFGLPGTQTVALYEALRQSGLRSVVTTHELGAAFMAAGFARASGKVGVLITIPGPGFAYAMAGLAEATHDGTPLLHITIAPAVGPTGEPGFQAIDQAAAARPLVKRTFLIAERMKLRSIVAEALAATLAERGSVLLELTDAVMHEEASDSSDMQYKPALYSDESHELVTLLLAAARPVILIVSDCGDESSRLTEIAQRGRIPVCVTAPHCGTIAEDNDWCLCFDDQRTDSAEFNAVLDQSDAVFVLGTQLTHVSTAGFGLRLPVERTICFASGAASLPHGYAARRIFRGNLSTFFQQLLAGVAQSKSLWAEAELRELRKRFLERRPQSLPEPLIEGDRPEAFFAALRAALPRDVIVVTDSGLHQALARRYFDVLSNRGLIFPSDFQSMGFGLPAAIGARLAAPARPVVVVMGDGGFAMSGMELLTAVRERIAVVAIVMNDGKLNLIRVQQLREYGREHGVDLHAAEFELLAAGMGAAYSRVDGDVNTVMKAAFSGAGPTVVEVNVGDSPSIRRTRLRSRAREAARGALGPGVVAWLKRRLR